MNHINKIWLAVCLAGPALGWVVGSDFAGGFTEQNWERRLILRVVRAGVTPLFVAILAVVHYERHQFKRLVPLLVLTALAVGTSYPALLDLVQGPQQERVIVTDAEVVFAPRYTTNCCTLYRVSLDDGRQLAYDSRVASQLDPGPYDVTVLRNRRAVLSVAGVPGHVTPGVSPVGWTLLGIGTAVASGLLALSWRAGRRERFVRAAESPSANASWLDGRSSAVTIYFAMLPSKTGGQSLGPTDWFYYAPAQAGLDTTSGPVLVDLQHALYGPPITCGPQWDSEQVRAELRRLACGATCSLPAAAKPPRGSEVWQHALPEGTRLHVFGNVTDGVLRTATPTRPVIITNAPPDKRPQALAFLKYAVAESVASMMFAAILATAFVLVTGYALLFY